MFDVFINAWKVKEIRKKLLYIVLLLLVFRLGSVIYLPGIDPQLIGEATGASNNLFLMIAGGSFGTVFYMGISPFITASIIMQLLTVAIPYLEELQKEGESGREKINQITRYVAVALAFLQGGATIYSMQGLFVYTHWFVYATALISLVGGTIFIMWIAELITDRKIGNGSSFIIFANILAGLPGSIMNHVGTTASEGGVAWLILAIVAILFVGIIIFTVRVQEGERRIPIHYARNMAGRRYGRGSDQFIPLKVNIAGVMSIIFAVNLLQLPMTINQFFPNDTLTTIADSLAIQKPLGAILYILLIFIFTFFYTSFAINPVEMAQNLKNSQGIIPGIRQGKPTSDFIQDSITKLSWIGAVYYSILAMIPVVIEWIFKISVGFGGTTLLIVTGVALELVNQLETQLVERHYKGFLGT